MVKKVEPKVATPDYISRLLKPIQGQQADRKVWSIPLAGVLVPFFTASNTTGETSIPSESLGCPLRLAREQDGTPKFSATGRPVVRVVKDIADQVRMMRDNYIFGLQSYTETVRKGMPDQFKAQVEANRLAGEPLALKDAADLEDYIVAQSEKPQAPAQAPSDNGQGVAEAEKVLATA